MDNPELPTEKDVLWPTTKALGDLGGSGTIQEINERAIEVGGFSEAQLAVPQGDTGLTKVEYRLYWARTSLKKVGAVTNSQRGVWALTEFGRQVTESQLMEAYQEWRRTLGAKASDDRNESENRSSSGVIDDGDPETWKAELLDHLFDMKPDALERLSQRLLREAGFVNVEVTRQSGDGGIDGTGLYQLSALVSFPTFFQCKRYRGSVSPGHVRDFRGAMAGRGDKGLFITTGSFTTEARREATRDGAQPIELIDGDKLCGLLKTYELGSGPRSVWRRTSASSPASSTTSEARLLRGARAS